jgi:hypothetical protein
MVRSLNSSVQLGVNYGLMNIEKIVNERTDDKKLSLSDKFEFIRSIYKTKEYANVGFKSSDNETLKLFSLNSMVGEGEYMLKDLCTLGSVSKDIMYYMGEDTYYRGNILDLRTFIENNLDVVISSLENDVNTAFLCFDAYANDTLIQQIKRALVMKYLYLNFYNDEGKMGVWNNELNVYYIEDNVFLIKMLLEEYEKVI